LFWLMCCCVVFGFRFLLHGDSGALFSFTFLWIAFQVIASLYSYCGRGTAARAQRV
jgi:hypothetical protein